jgi:hypothetical protein
MDLHGCEVLKTGGKGIIRNIRIHYMINDLTGGSPCKYEAYVLKFARTSCKIAQISSTLIIKLIFIFSILELNIF